MSSPAPPRHTAGFTLIELLVALAVVSLCVALAYPGLSAAIERMVRGRDNADAMLVAQSVLEGVGRDIALADGHAVGAADGYSWQVDVTPYDGDLVPATGALRAYRVQVTIGWTERSQHRQVGLSALRLARRGPSS
jgi:general secretion pathway protein I